MYYKGRSRGNNLVSLKGLKMILDFNFAKTWDSLTSFWLYKMLVSVFFTVIAFLFGELNSSYMALCVLIFLDLLSKWLEIVKNYMLENKTIGWYRSFIACWATGKLSSYEMRIQFIPKMMAYLMLIISAHQVSTILPAREVFGMQLGIALKDVIITYLALTEFMSINENIMAMGNSSLAPLSIFLREKRNKILNVDDAKIERYKGSYNKLEDIQRSPHGLGSIIRNESEDKNND